MSLSEGDVLEAEVENKDNLNVSEVNRDDYTILLDKEVDESLYKIKITELGHRFAFGEIIDNGENQ